MLAIGLVAAMAWAETTGAVDDHKVSEAWAPLDGRTFRGQMLSGEGKVLTDKERLVFKSGRFSSEACRQYGFGEAPYWVRIDNGGVHFLAETVSPTHGTMRWTGTVSGGQVNASFVWTKKRWYWTIEREFRVRAVQEK